MVIEINDAVFGRDNYEYEILINGNKGQFEISESGQIIIESQEEEVVDIRAKNIVFSSRWGWVLTLLYWLLALVTGSGESNPFGKPFDAHIQFKTGSKYVKLQANKIWKKDAFNILQGDLDIVRNEFVSTKKYIIHWCLGMVLPVNLLILAIFGVFIGVATGSEITVVLFCVAAFCLIGWNIYVYKILRALKRK